jgi:DNA-binding response OmpR family regulator
MADIKCTILFAEDDVCRYASLKNYLEVNDFNVLWHSEKDKIDMDTSENNLSIFKIGKYSLDTHQQLLRGPCGIRKLTSIENNLLKLLCQNKNNLLPRNFALESIWGIAGTHTARSMDVYITKIRKYLKDDPSLRLINIHGRGFRLII